MKDEGEQVDRLTALREMAANPGEYVIEGRYSTLDPWRTIMLALDGWFVLRDRDGGLACKTSTFPHWNNLRRIPQPKKTNEDYALQLARFVPGTPGEREVLLEIMDEKIAAAMKGVNGKEEG